MMQLFFGLIDGVKCYDLHFLLLISKEQITRRNNEKYHF